MWILVFFDLPTNTYQERRKSALFRKHLLTDGFGMFQESVYVRPCPSRENLVVHVKRVKSFIPDIGFVSILKITDKQYSEMELFYRSKKEAPVVSSYQQIELF